MNITKKRLKQIIKEEIEGVWGDRPLTELFGWGKKKKKEPEAAPEPIKSFAQQKEELLQQYKAYRERVHTTANVGKYRDVNSMCEYGQLGEDCAPSREDYKAALAAFDPDDHVKLVRKHLERVTVAGDRYLKALDTLYKWNEARMAGNQERKRKEKPAGEDPEYRECMDKVDAAIRDGRLGTQGGPNIRSEADEARERCSERSRKRQMQEGS
jgi:hypothetical protein